ncbi:MAG: hypothetical protein RBT61_03000 [Candidatus Kapabacteria bacterium]|jgi:hypothetical protein|nr:hypothetical protein [Candidatus Kapabacteria bacterium]
MKDRRFKVIKLLEQIGRLRLEMLHLLDFWYHCKSSLYSELTYKYDMLFGVLESELEEKKKLSAILDERINHIIRRYLKEEPIPINYLRNTFNLNFRIDSVGISNEGDVFEKIRSEHDYPDFHDDSSEQEFSDMYRKIVKKIHPDTNAESDFFHKFWNNILDAYSSKDMNRLRLFYYLICEELPEYDSDLNTEEDCLNSMISKYKRSVNLEKSKINMLLSSEPFVFEREMNDQSWIRERTLFIKSQIKAKDNYINKKRSLLKPILDRENP